ncbi:hypothetical protein AVEN_267928-1 [Araneus ventricosus]|uniref:Uncharacterized protein n=1 Tax=Araneus ventricosus TaxID=182803 RepID=A0A4Y2RRK2_ARAVE|nr:hypothetical protein AVEN_267928-1 [Araneus ventricosus]
MTPKGTANVLADSDGFFGIVAALCEAISFAPVSLAMSRCNSPAVYRQYEKGRHSFSHGNVARGKETLQESPYNEVSLQRISPYNEIFNRNVK